MTRHCILRIIAAWSMLTNVVASEYPGFLRWHHKEGRVDADIQGWPLSHTLERIAAATGWRVLVEPDLKAQVAARFENLPERPALATLLADLNFALVPAPTSSYRLLVFRSSSDRATLLIDVSTNAVAAASSNVLANELIVRLEPGSRTDPQELAARLKARLAGSIDSLNAHRFVFDDAESAEAARAALADDDSVASVESNYRLETPTRMESLNQPATANPSLKARPVSDGSSVVVALLDTGVSGPGVVHSDFLLPGVNLGAPGTSGDTGLSHGPAMFETILQGLSVTQSGADGQPVRVLPVDIYGAQTETSTFQLAQGLVAALEGGADLINLSLSGPAPSQLVQDVLQQAAAAGVLTFAAPGNEPTTSLTYPAAYPEVVAVTASERPGQIASYANRGNFVDLIAPGRSLVPYAGETWIVNGTSVSTAYATGLAAGLLADPARKSGDVLGELRRRIGFQPTPAPSPTP